MVKEEKYLQKTNFGEYLPIFINITSKKETDLSDVSDINQFIDKYVSFFISRITIISQT